MDGSGYDLHWRPRLESGKAHRSIADVVVARNSQLHNGRAVQRSAQGLATKWLMLHSCATLVVGKTSFGASKNHNNTLFDTVAKPLEMILDSCNSNFRW